MHLEVDDFEKRMIISGLYNDISALSTCASSEAGLVEDFDVMFSTIKAYIDLLDKIIYIKEAKK